MSNVKDLPLKCSSEIVKCPGDDGEREENAGGLMP
jgi:hypothetical protein